MIAGENCADLEVAEGSRDILFAILGEFSTLQADLVLERVVRLLGSSLFYPGLRKTLSTAISKRHLCGLARLIVRSGANFAQVFAVKHCEGVTTRAKSESN